MLALEVLGERIEPLELAREVLVPDVLAVGNVERGVLEVADPRGEQARAQRVLAGQSLAHHLDRLARQDRDTVPPALAVGDRLVSGGGELGGGKVLVLELELLDADDVGLTRAQPVQHEVQPRPQAVDVPGGDAHARIVRGRRRPFRVGNW